MSKELPASHSATPRTLPASPNSNNNDKTDQVQAKEITNGMNVLTHVPVLANWKPAGIQHMRSTFMLLSPQSMHCGGT